MCRYLSDNHVVPDADVAAYVKLMLQSMAVDMKRFLLEVKIEREVKIIAAMKMIGKEWKGMKESKKP